MSNTILKSEVQQAQSLNPSFRVYNLHNTKREEGLPGHKGSDIEALLRGVRGPTSSRLV